MCPGEKPRAWKEIFSVNGVKHLRPGTVRASRTSRSLHTATIGAIGAVLVVTVVGFGGVRAAAAAGHGI
jgi:hypothetical protein